MTLGLKTLKKEDCEAPLRLPVMTDISGGCWESAQDELLVYLYPGCFQQGSIMTIFLCFSASNACYPEWWTDTNQQWYSRSLHSNREGGVRAKGETGSGSKEDGKDVFLLPVDEWTLTELGCICVGAAGCLPVKRSTSRCCRITRVRVMMMVIIARGAAAGSNSTAPLAKPTPILNYKSKMLQQ